MNFKLLKREIETKNGKEIVIEKRHLLNKDRNKDRLWVLQPQDPVYKNLYNQMKMKGLWA